MTLFTALSSKIFAALSVGLLIVVVILYFQLKSANEEIDRQKGLVAQCDAARRVQNAAIEAVRLEGERQRLAFAEANERGAQLIRDAEGKVTVVRSTVRNGCPTPAVIMGAGL